MSKLLDKFINTLPKLQARSIERELQSKENRVKFPSPAQFKEEFIRRLKLLLESEGSIKYSSIPIVDSQKRRSETLNYMLKQISGDLDSLYPSSDTLAELVDLQIQIYERDILFKLERALAEAETELESIELLLGNSSGLKDSIVERFRTGSNRLKRDTQLSTLIYGDPKTHKQLSAKSDMIVDVSKGGLALPINRSSLYNPTGVREVLAGDVRDEDDQFFSLGGASPSTSGQRVIVGSILNIIDNQLDTYYITSIRTDKALANGANITLLVDLGRPRKINFIDIEPVSSFPQKVTEIYYSDKLANVKTITLPVGGIDLTEKVRVHIKTVEAEKIVVVVRQENEILAPEEGVARRLGVVYSFGIDNIKVGEASYQDIGIYVSRTLTADKISSIHLDATSNANMGVDSEETLDPLIDPLPTMEYWIHFRDIDDGDNIVFSKFLPILPVGITGIREKIYIQHNSKATLNFAVDHTIEDNDAEVRLYRDGTVLVRGIDYTIDVPDSVVAEPSVLSIDDAFNQDNEYMAEYIPLHTISNRVDLPFKDSTGLIKYNQNNTIQIERPGSSRAVRSEINLIILMRNVGNQEHTSVLDRYVLSVG